MAEYINKQLAIEELENLRQQYEMRDDCDELVARKCKEAVSALPAADVAPVVLARWKFFHKKNKAVCTNCSYERDLDWNLGRAVACPNCGATMDT